MKNFECHHFHLIGLICIIFTNQILFQLANQKLGMCHATWENLKEFRKGKNMYVERGCAMITNDQLPFYYRFFRLK